MNGPPQSIFIKLPLLCLLLLASCRSTVPANLAAPGAPLTGFYRCWSGGFDHLPAGTFTLSSTGHYESYRPGGGGSYAFSPGTSAINFLSGDYHYWEYRGVVQSARIVLMPLGAKAPSGTERPGEYQYCYREAESSTARN